MTTTCSICLEEIADAAEDWVPDPRQFRCRCRVRAHRACLHRWLAHSSSCFLCRRQVAVVEEDEEVRARQTAEFLRGMRCMCFLLLMYLNVYVLISFLALLLRSCRISWG